MGKEMMGHDKCFVIMPFSKTTVKRTEKYWTDHYNNFLKPKIESVEGIQAERSKPLRGQILKDIITDLISSDIVVADLTDNNPNVFYELGIRQSFKHGTITIAEDGSQLPFFAQKVRNTNKTLVDNASRFNLQQSTPVNILCIRQHNTPTNRRIEPFTIPRSDRGVD